MKNIILIDLLHSWAGFRKLGIKINTFGDIQGVYFKDRVEGAFGKREFLESNIAA